MQSEAFTLRPPVLPMSHVMRVAGGVAGLAKPQEVKLPPLMLPMSHGMRVVVAVAFATTQGGAVPEKLSIVWHSYKAATPT